jgi:hypothetical protein
MKPLEAGGAPADHDETLRSGSDTHAPLPPFTRCHSVHLTSLLRVWWGLRPRVHWLQKLGNRPLGALGAITADEDTAEPGETQLFLFANPCS